jgi:hypothetical protein
MTLLKLLQTEKSLNQQASHKYIFVLDELQADINKTELMKLFVKNKLKPTKVNVVKPYVKLKTKNNKKKSIRKVQRPKRYFVTFAEKQKFDENFTITL